MIRGNNKFLNYFRRFALKGMVPYTGPDTIRTIIVRKWGGMRQRRPSSEGLGLQFEQFGQAWPGRRDSTAGHAEDWPMRKAHH